MNGPNKINPEHYFSRDKSLEAIDVIEAFELDFHRASAFQYIIRAGKKPGVTFSTDIKKAIWFLERVLVYCKKVTPIEPNDRSHRSLQPTKGEEI